MYNGTITLAAALTDNTISFAAFDYKPAVPGVENASIAADGHAIFITVHVSGVASPEDGERVARAAAEAALNRLAYFHQVVIKPAKTTSRSFTAVDGGGTPVAAPGYFVLEGQVARLIVGISRANLASELEPSCIPGETSFGELRSARLSISPVEEFMHLYSIVAELVGDDQRLIDEFILKVEPNVPLTASPNPRAKAGTMETVYTRLRNELAHRRHGVTMETTKAQMARLVGNLRGIAREAIARSP